MNSNHVIKNPWGRGKVSLKGKKLNENEKMYLAQLVNKDGKTCEYVANTYSLSKSVLGKYVRSIKNGVKLHNLSIEHAEHYQSLYHMRLYFDKK